MVYVNLSKITSAANRRWAFRTKWIFFVKRSNSIKSCWLWIQSSKDISESQNIFKSPFLVAADWQRFKLFEPFLAKRKSSCADQQRYLEAFLQRKLYFLPALHVWNSAGTKHQEILIYFLQVLPFQVLLCVCISM